MPPLGIRSLSILAAVSVLPAGLAAQQQQGPADGISIARKRVFSCYPNVVRRTDDGRIVCATGVRERRVKQVVLMPGATTCAADATTSLETRRLRQRIVTTAALQWEAFGFQFLDAATPQLRALPAARRFYVTTGRPAPPESKHRPRLLRLGRTEDDRRVDRFIARYWAVTDPAVIETQNEIWKVSSYAGWATPWSAAFVSWVMCRAGLSRKLFARSARHVDYIDAAISGDSAFRATDLSTGLPRPGDLVCASRSDKHAYRSVADRLKDLGVGVPAHCDIVVKVNRRIGLVFAIGGNVGNSVSMTAILVRWKGRRGEIVPNATRNWFAILRLKKKYGGDVRGADLERAPLEIWSRRSPRAR